MPPRALAACLLAAALAWSIPARGETPDLPCGQEPGSREEIKRFCEAGFDVTFPLADKQVVSGAAAHPLYRWAAAQTGALGVPQWNFHKILIGRDGRVVDWFSAAGGLGPKLERAIEAALAAPG